MPYDPDTLLAAYVPNVPSNTLAVDGHEDLLHELDRQELRGLKGAIGLGLGTPTRGTAIFAGADGESLWDRAARPNLLYNGTGRIKQRAALPTADNAYGFDRWRLLLEAANAATLSQETSDLPVPGPGHAIKLTIGSGNNNKAGHWQPVLFATMRDVAGGTVSLQAKLKTTAGITNVRMGVMQFAGTADSISGDPISSWGADGTNPTLAASWSFANTPANLGVTTSWATYRVENISIASTAKNLAVLVWIDDKSTTQTTDSLLMTDVKMERGAVCTELERIDEGEELARCLDWLEVVNAASGASMSFGSGYVNNATTATLALDYARKRANPVLSYSAASDFTVAHGGTGTACTAISDLSPGPTRATVVATVAAGLTTGQGCRLIGSNTSAAITISAEP